MTQIAADAGRAGRTMSYRLALFVALVASGSPALAQQPPPDDAARTGLVQTQAAPQTPPAALRLTAPAVVLADPGSEVAMPILVAPDAAIPKNSFLRVRGLPPTVALSVGHAIAPGAWAVPILAARNLRLTLPVGVSGRREIVIALVALEGTQLAETRTQLIVAAARLISPDEKPQAPAVAAPAAPPVATKPAPKPAPKAPTVAAPAVVAPPAAPTPPAAPPVPPAPAVAMPAAPPAPAPAPPPPPAPVLAKPVLPPPAATPPAPAAPSPPPQPRRATVVPPTAPIVKVVPVVPLPQPKAAPQRTLSPQEREAAERLYKRGEDMLRTGDVASARLFLERAAERGLAEAALAMGGTFDPVELARLRVQGTRPDPEQARAWYERAAKLGSVVALDRLKTLGSR